MSVQASLSLGAYDLKRNAVRSLGIAFLISLLFHFLLLGGKEVIDIVLGNSAGSGDENIIATGPVTLDDFKEDVKEDDQQVNEEVIPPPPPMAATADLGTGSEGAMGKLVESNEVIDNEISGYDEMSHSDPLGGGDGGVKPFNPDDITMPTKPMTIPSTKAAPSNEGDMDEYVADAKLPEYDLAELQRLLDYPDLARENGIEGRVVVSVQVSTTGKPLKVVIRSSTNKIFEENAKKAVQKLRFTPGTQGGHPIKLWRTFDVKFVLND